MFRPKTSNAGRLENSSGERTAPPSGGSSHLLFVCQKKVIWRLITKTSRIDWFLWLFSSGERIRTTDLRVMSPTSYLCSTPQ